MSQAHLDHQGNVHLLEMAKAYSFPKFECLACDALFTHLPIASPIGQVLSQLRSLSPIYTTCIILS